MASHPLLKNLSSEEILEAAERWMALMHTEGMAWVARAGFEGDFFPTEHPNERHLTVSMWNHLTVPGLEPNDQATQEAKELLTQFADVVRASMVAALPESSWEEVEAVPTVALATPS